MMKRNSASFTCYFLENFVKFLFGAELLKRPVSSPPDYLSVETVDGLQDMF